MLAAGWAVFVAAVLPVSGLTAFAFQAHSTVADRYLYLAMLGVAMAVAGGFSIWNARGRKGDLQGDAEGAGGEVRGARVSGTLSRNAGLTSTCQGPEESGGARSGETGNRQSESANRKSIGVAAGLALVAVLGTMSWRQAGHWRDSVSLVARALEVNPESVEMNYARANQYYDTGDVETSIAFYRKALAGDARHWRAHHLLANALGEKGDWGRALGHLRAAEAMVPEHPAVLGDLGYALAATGDRRAAEAMYRRALEAVPGDVRSRHDLGVLLLERGAFAEAVAELRRVWETAPDETTAWNFGKALERYAGQLEGEGKREEAKAARAEAAGLRVR